MSRVANLVNFCARVSGISFKDSYLQGFASHRVHAIKIPAFECLKHLHIDRVPYRSEVYTAKIYRSLKMYTLKLWQLSKIFNHVSEI